MNTVDKYRTERVHCIRMAKQAIHAAREAAGECDAAIWHLKHARWLLDAAGIWRNIEHTERALQGAP